MGSDRFITATTDKVHPFFKCLEAGLAQQDRTGPCRWPFDNCLWRDATLGHVLLHGIDIQGARCQVVDMRPLEADHIGNQTMGVMKFLIGFKR